MHNKELRKKKGRNFVKQTKRMYLPENVPRTN
jgi:hypothetical protein